MTSALTACGISVFHPEASNHVAREVGRLTDVRFGARRLVAVDNLLCRTAAAGDHDVRKQALLVVVEAVARSHSSSCSASPWRVEEALRDRSRDDRREDDDDRITRVDGSGLRGTHGRSASIRREPPPARPFCACEDSVENGPLGVLDREIREVDRREGVVLGPRRPIAPRGRR